MTATSNQNVSVDHIYENLPDTEPTRHAALPLGVCGGSSHPIDGPRAGAGPACPPNGLAAEPPRFSAAGSSGGLGGCASLRNSIRPLKSENILVPITDFLYIFSVGVEQIIRIPGRVQ